MKNWLTSLVALAGAAVSIFTPQIHDGISAHPTVAAIVAAVYAIFAHIMPSPTGSAVITQTGETGKATMVTKNPL